MHMRRSVRTLRRCGSCPRPSSATTAAIPVGPSSRPSSVLLRFPVSILRRNEALVEPMCKVSKNKMAFGLVFRAVAPRLRSGIGRWCSNTANENWAGNIQWNTAATTAPSSVEQLQDIVKGKSITLLASHLLFPFISYAPQSSDGTSYQ